MNSYVSKSDVLRSIIEANRLDVSHKVRERRDKGTYHVRKVRQDGEVIGEIVERTTRKDGAPSTVFLVERLDRAADEFVTVSTAANMTNAVKGLLLAHAASFVDPRPATNVTSGPEPERTSEMITRANRCPAPDVARRAAEIATRRASVYHMRSEPGAAVGREWYDFVACLYNDRAMELEADAHKGYCTVTRLVGAVEAVLRVIDDAATADAAREAMRDAVAYLVEEAARVAASHTSPWVQAQLGRALDCDVVRRARAIRDAR